MQLAVGGPLDVADVAVHPPLPLVTIVVPVFNNASTVRQSLESILAQTYPNLEVLVMDDASTDGTPAILGDFAGRVRVARQPRNRGQFENVNDGLAQAHGTYVAVYHADDVYEPRIVEREVAFLEAHPEVGAIFASDRFIDANGRELGRLVLPPGVPPEQPLDYATVLNALLTYKNRFLRGPSALVRRDAYMAVGNYNDAYGIASDLEMWLRIARQYPVAVLGEHLFRYRRGHGSSSDQYHSLRTEPEGYFRILDEHLASTGRVVAQPTARADFEAHRAEERLMRVIAWYILNKPAEARGLLAQVDPRRILASPRVERVRLLTLWALLNVLVRTPRVRSFADYFYRRWHARTAR